MAGRKGFEPLEACTSTVFKTAAFDHSAISRKIKIAKIWRRHPDSNRRSRLCRPMPYRLAMSPIVVPGAGLEPARKKKFRGILSPLCLPIPPPGRMERETRFELATPTLARLCSTTELFPQNKS